MLQDIEALCTTPQGDNVPRNPLGLSKNQITVLNLVCLGCSAKRKNTLRSFCANTYELKMDWINSNRQKMPTSNFKTPKGS